MLTIFISLLQVTTEQQLFSTLLSASKVSLWWRRFYQCVFRDIRLRFGSAGGASPGERGLGLVKSFYPSRGSRPDLMCVILRMEWSHLKWMKEQLSELLSSAPKCSEVFNNDVGTVEGLISSNQLSCLTSTAENEVFLQVRNLLIRSKPTSWQF